MDSAQRKIMAAMIVTGLFALVGEYADPRPGASHPNPFKVILGGSIATALLVGMAELGEPGERLGLGFATIAVISATLVYGGPVWSVISKAVSPTGKGGTSTPPTNPTGLTGQTSPLQTATVLAPTVAAAVAG